MSTADVLLLVAVSYFVGRRRGRLDAREQQVPAATAAYLMGFEHGMAEAARKAAGP